MKLARERWVKGRRRPPLARLSDRRRWKQRDRLLKPLGTLAVVDEQRRVVAQLLEGGDRGEHLRLLAAVGRLPRNL